MPRRVAQLRFEARVGVGSRGQVFKATTNEGELVAVKVGSRDDDETHNEVRALERVQPHPNIISMLSAVEYSADSAFIVLEFCDTDLLEIIMASGTGLDSERALLYFRQLCKAVRHCHLKKVFHGDIKPENALIKDGNIKLCDFGSASFAARTTKAAGSVFYAAPEVLPLFYQHSDATPMAAGAESLAPHLIAPSPSLVSSGGAGEHVHATSAARSGGAAAAAVAAAKLRAYDAAAADVWSLGVVLYVMLSGHPPWAEASLYDAEFVRFVRAGPGFAFPDAFSAGAVRVLRAMLQPRPRERCSLADVLRDPWVTPLGPAQASLEELRRAQALGHAAATGAHLLQPQMPDPLPLPSQPARAAAQRRRQRRQQTAAEAAPATAAMAEDGDGVTAAAAAGAAAGAAVEASAAGAASSGGAGGGAGGQQLKRYYRRRRPGEEAASGGNFLGRGGGRGSGSDREMMAPQLPRSLPQGYSTGGGASGGGGGGALAELPDSASTDLGIQLLPHVPPPASPAGGYSSHSSPVECRCSSPSSCSSVEGAEGTAAAASLLPSRGPQRHPPPHHHHHHTRPLPLLAGVSSGVRSEPQPPVQVLRVRSGPQKQPAAAAAAASNTAPSSPLPLGPRLGPAADGGPKALPRRGSTGGPQLQRSSTASQPARGSPFVLKLSPGFSPAGTTPFGSVGRTPFVTGTTPFSFSASGLSRQLNTSGISAASSYSAAGSSSQPGSGRVSRPGSGRSSQPGSGRLYRDDEPVLMDGGGAAAAPPQHGRVRSNSDDLAIMASKGRFSTTSSPVVSATASPVAAAGSSGGGGGGGGMDVDRGGSHGPSSSSSATASASAAAAGPASGGHVVPSSAAPSESSPHPHPLLLHSASAPASAAAQALPLRASEDSPMAAASHSGGFDGPGGGGAGLRIGGSDGGSHGLLGSGGGLRLGGLSIRGAARLETIETPKVLRDATAPPTGAASAASGTSKLSGSGGSSAMSGPSSAPLPLPAHRLRAMGILGFGTGGGPPMPLAAAGIPGAGGGGRPGHAAGAAAAHVPSALSLFSRSAGAAGATAAAAQATSGVSGGAAGSAMDVDGPPPLVPPHAGALSLSHGALSLSHGGATSDRAVIDGDVDMGTSAALPHKLEASKPAVPPPQPMQQQQQQQEPMNPMMRAFALRQQLMERRMAAEAAQQQQVQQQVQVQQQTQSAEPPPQQQQQPPPIVPSASKPPSPQSQPVNPMMRAFALRQQLMERRMAAEVARQQQQQQQDSSVAVDAATMALSGLSIGQQQQQHAANPFLASAMSLRPTSGVGSASSGSPPMQVATGSASPAFSTSSQFSASPSNFAAASLGRAMPGGLMMTPEALLQLQQQQVAPTFSLPSPSQRQAPGALRLVTAVPVPPAAEPPTATGTPIPPRQQQQRQAAAAEDAEDELSSRAALLGHSGPAFGLLQRIGSTARRAVEDQQAARGISLGFQLSGVKMRRARAGAELKRRLVPAAEVRARTRAREKRERARDAAQARAAAAAAAAAAGATATARSGEDGYASATSVDSSRDGVGGDGDDDAVSEYYYTDREGGETSDSARSGSEASDSEADHGGGLGGGGRSRRAGGLLGAGLASLHRVSEGIAPLSVAAVSALAASGSASVPTAAATAADRRLLARPPPAMGGGFLHDDDGEHEAAAAAAHDDHAAAATAHHRRGSRRRTSDETSGRGAAGRARHQHHRHHHRHHMAEGDGVEANDGSASPARSGSGSSSGAESDQEDLVRGGGGGGAAASSRHERKRARVQLPRQGSSSSHTTLTSASAGSSGLHLSSTNSSVASGSTGIAASSSVTAASPSLAAEGIGGIAMGRNAQIAAAARARRRANKGLRADQHSSSSGSKSAGSVGDDGSSLPGVSLRCSEVAAVTGGGRRGRRLSGGAAAGAAAAGAAHEGGLDGYDDEDDDSDTASRSADGGGVRSCSAESESNTSLRQPASRVLPRQWSSVGSSGDDALAEADHLHARVQAALPERSATTVAPSLAPTAPANPSATAPSKLVSSSSSMTRGAPPSEQEPADDIVALLTGGMWTVGAGGTILTSPQIAPPRQAPRVPLQGAAPSNLQERGDSTDDQTTSRTTEDSCASSSYLSGSGSNSDDESYSQSGSGSGSEGSYRSGSSSLPSGVHPTRRGVHHCATATVADAVAAVPAAAAAAANAAAEVVVAAAAAVTASSATTCVADLYHPSPVDISPQAPHTAEATPTVNSTTTSTRTTDSSATSVLTDAPPPSVTDAPPPSVGLKRLRSRVSVSADSTSSVSHSSLPLPGGTERATSSGASATGVDAGMVVEEGEDEGDSVASSPAAIRPRLRRNPGAEAITPSVTPVSSARPNTNAFFADADANAFVSHLQQQQRAAGAVEGPAAAATGALSVVDAACGTEADIFRVSAVPGAASVFRNASVASMSSSLGGMQLDDVSPPPAAAAASGRSEVAAAGLSFLRIKAPGPAPAAAAPPASGLAALPAGPSDSGAAMLPPLPRLHSLGIGIGGSGRVPGSPSLCRVVSIPIVVASGAGAASARGGGGVAAAAAGGGGGSGALHPLPPQHRPASSAQPSSSSLGSHAHQGSSRGEAGPRNDSVQAVPSRLAPVSRSSEHPPSQQ